MKVAGALRRLAVCIAGLAGGGCMTSHALLQTAHTQPAGQWRIKAGVAGVFNAIDGSGGRSLATNVTPEPNLRVGLSDSMDVGLAPWLGNGAGLDAKVNLLDPRSRAALAPRLMAGYALGSSATNAEGTYGVEAGLIASYRLHDRFEPYAALSFANHWFMSKNIDSSKQLSPNQYFAPRRGYGDGLVKAAVGVDIRFASEWHYLVEYAHWFPAQNDVGDGYTLLSNDILALSLAYCVPVR